MENKPIFVAGIDTHCKGYRVSVYRFNTLTEELTKEALMYHRNEKGLIVNDDESGETLDGTFVVATWAKVLLEEKILPLLDGKSIEDIKTFCFALSAKIQNAEKALKTQPVNISSLSMVPQETTDELSAPGTQP